VQVFSKEEYEDGAKNVPIELRQKPGGH